MKKLILCAMLLSMARLSIAQEASIIRPEPMHKGIDSLFENIDFSGASTHFVMDKAVQFLSAEKFNGEELNDKNLLNKTKWSWLYAMLMMSATDALVSLPHPKQLYRHKVESNAPIPLVLLSQNYNHLRLDAIDKGLIALKGNRLYSLESDENAFATRTLFAACAIKMQCKSKQIFVLPSDKIINNKGEIATISINVGKEDITIKINEPFTLNFTKEAQKVILKVKYTNGEVLQTHFVVEIPEIATKNLLAVEDRGGVDESYLDPQDTNFNQFTEVFDVTATKGFQGDDGFDFGKAKVTIFYSCPGKTLRKPLIMVDGFNTDVGIDETGVYTFKNQTTALSSLKFFKNYDNTPYKTVINKRSLAQEFRKAGYDLVFVDWISREGRDYLQRSAFCLEDILTNINQRKAVAGSIEKNVILGYSMGGPITKYALLDMEQNNLNPANSGHDVGKFIGYDGALQGANIPISAQYLFTDLGETTIAPLITNALFGQAVKIRDVIEEIDHTIIMFQSPAAKQMLLHQYNEDENLVFLPPDNIAFYNELNDLGKLQQCEYYNITNGSVLSEENFPAGSNLFTIDGNGINLLLANLQVEIKVDALPIQSNNFVAVYDREIRAHINFTKILNPPGNNTFKLKAKNVRALDGCPGGTTSVFDPSLAISTTFTSFLGNNIGITTTVGSYPDGDMEPFHPCFIPTFSGLDIKSPENNNVFLDCSNPSFVNSVSVGGSIDNTGSLGDPLLDKSSRARNSYDPLPGLRDEKRFINQAHVALSYRGASFLAYYLLPRNDLDWSSTTKPVQLNTRTYNFGTSNFTPINYSNFFEKETFNTIDFDLIVSGTGKISINNNGKIAFIDKISNPNNLVQQKKPYEAFIQRTNICKESAKVTVKNGGLFEIGAYPTVVEPGHLIVKKQGVLEVEVNGTINVTEKSKLIAQTQGIVHINGGVLSLVKGSSTIIENGGKVELSTGTTELRDNSQIIIQAGGELIVKPNATTNLHNNTQIVVKPNGKLTIQGGANFNLRDYAEIVVEQGGTLNIENGTNPVVFNGAAGVDNPIKILGLLSVGSPVQFRGGAYFDFHQGHILTLTNTFYVTGDGNKMMNLQENVALFLKNQDVNWNSGRVQYKNNSRVVLPIQKSVDCSSVAFEGNSKGQGMIGLINNNLESPNVLRLNACVFNHLDICISLEHEEVITSPEEFTIDNTDFNEYRTIGILASRGKSIIANYSNFRTSVAFSSNSIELPNLLPTQTPPALVLTEYGLGDKPTVVFSSCHFYGNRANVFNKIYDSSPLPGESYLSFLNNDPQIQEEYGYEIALKGVANFTMQNGTAVHDAFNAIIAESSNINLLSDTKLYENGIGIRMTGDFVDDKAGMPSTGRVTMDCASMLRNALGIAGQNIWLNIDEYINSQGHNTNTFAQYFGGADVGRLFDINYDFSAIPTLQHLYPSNTIAATFNRWESGIPNSKEDYIFDTKQQLDLDLFPANFNNDNICEILKEKTYDDSDFGDIANDKVKGGLTINGTYQSVMPVFWTGFSSYLAGNIPQAQKILAPLSAINYEEKGEIENPYIQQMIDVAKTIVYATGKDGDIVIKSKIQKTPTSNIKIYPNPATERINISLPTGNFDISVMDNQGRNVFKTNNDTETTINTSNWLSGIYHVILKNTATGEQEMKKVVVMKKD